jgi:hypothetical protein
MLSRVATTLLLCFQLTVLAVGTLPERDTCCCVAKGKVCKCKSHAPKHAGDASGPCFQAKCSSGGESAFPVVTWVTLPEPRVVPVLKPTAVLEWPRVTEGPARSERPETPPPRRLG